MVKVLVPVADGTEELEAVSIIDILVRAEARVVCASVMPQTLITASRGVKIQADCLITDCAGEWDMIVLPGGLPGADNLAASEPLLNLIKQQMAGDKWLAAICASPAVVLGRHGLLEGRTATCYPGFQSELAEQVASVSEKRVVTDGKLITSQGPGTATEFALELVAALFGIKNAKTVADGLLTPFPVL